LKEERACNLKTRKGKGKGGGKTANKALQTALDRGIKTNWGKVIRNTKGGTEP